MILLLLSSTLLSAQQITEGYIYNDENANGKKDRREKGIANVPVSNKY